MIRIYCVNCKVLLEIDDGFAGGVCRCIHCGKMQSVPKASRSSARTAVPDIGSPTKEGPGMRPSSGSPILSPSSVMGSGLGSDNLRSVAKSGNVQPPAAKPNLRVLFWGFVAVIVLLSGWILWIMLDGGTENVTQTHEPASAANNNVVNPPRQTTPGLKSPEPSPDVSSAFAPPSFAGVILTEPSVVYLIDRSGLSDDAVALVKKAVLKSIDSLHTDQQFQIILWKSEGGEVESATGSTGLARATPDGVAAATAELLAETTGTKIIESDDAPKDAAISQPDFSAPDFAPKQDFSDNPGPPGQTFTPASNLNLQAVTVKGFGNSPRSFGLVALGRVTLTISRVDQGDVLTQIDQESATGGFTKGGAYQTFILSKPVPLNGGTQYAYNVFSEAGFYGFAKSKTDVYPGGAAIQHGKSLRGVTDKAKIANPQPVDRTFFINPTGFAGIGKNAMELALAENPAVVVIVTGGNFDEPLAARMLEVRNNSSVKFNVVHVGDANIPPGVMGRLAERTGGQFRAATLDSLQPKRN